MKEHDDLMFLSISLTFYLDNGLSESSIIKIVFNIIILSYCITYYIIYINYYSKIFDCQLLQNHEEIYEDIFDKLNVHTPGYIIIY